ncbi:contact-dependent growth inhibition system immunity protein [Streptomyces sp. URMC 123]|uniref:contact-dependent growth inhibition system immunity protein n=1 Tax=Streptomyces sp. URMC 123 TaxID=3423403 RepID=UPI003F1DE5EC
MAHPSAPGHRFYELQSLLRAYTHAGYAFTDTPSAPGPALEGYVRVVSRFPERGVRVLHELDDLLSVGLLSSEIADDVALLPRVRPTGGRSIEESLRIAREHIRAAVRNPEQRAGQAPRMDWEWEEFFPSLSQLLGGYFHQDFPDTYSSHREALDDYLRGTPDEELRRVLGEIPQALDAAGDEAGLVRASVALGMAVDPPDGVTLRQWLINVAGVIRLHLRNTASD